MFMSLAGIFIVLSSGCRHRIRSEKVRVSGYVDLGSKSMAITLLIFQFTVEFVEYMRVALCCAYDLTVNLYEMLTSMYVEFFLVSYL